jgi:hypothetical protein
MTITITIQADNAAFEDGGYREVAHVLQKAVRLDGPIVEGDHISLYDSNGNKVGALVVGR